MAQQPSGRPQRRAIDDIRVTVKVTEIDEQMSELAQDVAKETLCSTVAKEKDVAAAIKKKFDDTYGPTWHCIVGRNFGSYVTHETNHFLYFFIENMAVLLFKSA